MLGEFDKQVDKLIVSVYWTQSPFCLPVLCSLHFASLQRKV